MKEMKILLSGNLIEIVTWSLRMHKINKMIAYGTW